MYLGAMGPSAAQVLIFLLFILVLSIVRPKDMPPLPKEVRGDLNWALVAKVLLGIVPSMVLIFLVLGTIFIGLATPTEAGALGVVGAFVLAALHGRLTFPLIKQAIHSTADLTAMVVFILVGSTVFSLVFQGMDGGLWIEHLLSHLPGGPIGFLIFVNIFIFFLAFFLDFFEIAFIVVPMLAPVAAGMGIDLVWFGVLLCINMQTSFMHPPFGFALFYLRSIAPREVLTKDIYIGAIPWLFMQLMLVVIVIFWPGMVTDMLDKAPDVDLSTVKIELPANNLSLGAPGAGLGVPGGLGGGLGGVPAPGAPVIGQPNLGQPAN
jgi:tripartite ATP-independent transporter DctM subunit